MRRYRKWMFSYFSFK